MAVKIGVTECACCGAKTETAQENTPVVTSDGKVFTMCVTGPRPQQVGKYLGFKGSDAFDITDVRYDPLRAAIRSAIIKMVQAAKEQGATEVRLISGMALGIDSIFIQEAAKIRDKAKMPIHVFGAFPYTNHGSNWKEGSLQVMQQTVWSLLDEYHYVYPHPAGDDFGRLLINLRKWMVDHVDAVLGVWDGNITHWDPFKKKWARSDTANCLNYASSKGKPCLIINLPDLSVNLLHDADDLGTNTVHPEFAVSEDMIQGALDAMGFVRKEKEDNK